jgi:hypothetical protein
VVFEIPSLVDKGVAENHWAGDLLVLIYILAIDNELLSEYCSVERKGKGGSS